MNLSKPILVDGRWQGQHGIARYAEEIASRLENADILTQGPHPLSLKNLFWQSKLLSHKQEHKVFFSPGFNPTLHAKIPVIFTIHDLTHLQPGQASLLKKWFYQFIIKPAAKKAYKIITVSNYSKQQILAWSGISADKIEVVYPSISQIFCHRGDKYQPGFPYLLHIGNTKKHKNLERLIQAFAKANIDNNIKLILTGEISTQLADFVTSLHLQHRILIHSALSESTLAQYYRGALGITFPSLYEGFGLPIIEGMASGVPVLTSTTTSMPEVAKDAAILVDPYNIQALKHGLEELVNHHELRQDLIQKGLSRAQDFSWDESAQKIQTILNQAMQGK